MTENELLDELSQYLTGCVMADFDPARHVTYQTVMDRYGLTMDAARDQLAELVKKGVLRKIKVRVPGARYCVAFEKV